MKTVPLGPFLGMNNRLPDTRLHVKDKGDFVRNAVNVDVTTAGTVKRRQGLTKLVGGDSCHSFYAHGDDAYYADGANLYRLTGTLDTPARILVRDDLPLGRTLSFCDMAGTLIYSDGLELHRLTGSVSERYTIPTPNLAPSITITTGALPGGLYQVTYTSVGPQGMESGAFPPVQVSVPDNGGLSIAVPDNTRVFVSPCNGDMLFFVGEGPIVSVTTPTDGGEPCQTLNLHPLPGGDIVRYRYGRLHVAKGEVLYYSQPFAPGLFNPLGDWLVFPEKINVLEPINQGIWLVTDKTYWMPGTDPSKAELLEQLPYGAAFGSGLSFPDRNQVAWMSDRGMCLADGSGAVQNVQEANVVTNPVASGAVMLREEDGMKQLLASSLEAGQSLAAARTFMDAEVIRKESLL
ncbi:MAG: hypothetical protein WBI41_05940 [Azovibrio sp.]|uniref:hypothetical protein n=1 Tax=Azovibrio sp. TaxID=1872673 RepID=UPI003C743419